MGNEAELLRMLEPAVRPGGLPGPLQKPSVPIESRSFESLLDEARQDSKASQPGRETPADQPASADAKQNGMISQLAQVEKIENSSLRGLIEGNSASVSNQTPNSTDHN